MTNNSDGKAKGIPIKIHYVESEKREPVELKIHYVESEKKPVPMPVTLVRS